MYLCVYQMSFTLSRLYSGLAYVTTVDLDSVLR